MVNKDSWEELHDTTNAFASFIEGEAIKKATQCFADTIAEYGCELSGKQLYACFYAAAIENLNYADKEYKKAKQLVDSLHYTS